MQDDRIIRLPEVIQKTGRSRASIYRDMDAGRFPSPRRLGPNAVGWPKSEIDAWMNNLPFTNEGGSNA